MLVQRVAGESGWEELVHEVTPGRHTFEFVYRKTQARPAGEDNVRIDDLRVEGSVGLCE